MVLFDLPMRGSWLELLLAISLFSCGALGTGLLISTLADSQLVAFQIVLLVAFLPTFILSGFIFPISQHAGADPARHLRRAGALLPRRAARHRAEGRRPRRVIWPTSWRW